MFCDAARRFRHLCAIDTADDDQRSKTIRSRDHDVIMDVGHDLALPARERARCRSARYEFLNADEARLRPDRFEEKMRIAAPKHPRQAAQPRRRFREATEGIECILARTRDDHAIAAPASVDLHDQRKTQPGNTGFHLAFARDRNGVGRADAEFCRCRHRLAARQHGREFLRCAERAADERRHRCGRVARVFFLVQAQQVNRFFLVVARPPEDRALPCESRTGGEGGALKRKTVWFQKVTQRPRPPSGLMVRGQTVNRPRVAACIPPRQRAVDTQSTVVTSRTLRAIAGILGPRSGANACSVPGTNLEPNSTQSG